mmetsp:Transcript_3424/g.9563  ORF Transcript_3424/g.9563 Transcript_3424/m.9563 type:complete len:225 (-) Transcript_3424:556-1230(-)
MVPASAASTQGAWCTSCMCCAAPHSQPTGAWCPVNAWWASPSMQRRWLLGVAIDAAPVAAGRGLPANAPAAQRRRRRLLVEPGADAFHSGAASSISASVRNPTAKSRRGRAQAALSVRTDGALCAHLHCLSRVGSSGLPLQATMSSHDVDEHRSHGTSCAYFHAQRVSSCPPGRSSVVENGPSGSPDTRALTRWKRYRVGRLGYDIDVESSAMRRYVSSYTDTS